MCVVMWTRGIRLCCHRMCACEGWWGVRHQSHTNCQLFRRADKCSHLSIFLNCFHDNLVMQLLFNCCFVLWQQEHTSLSHEFRTGSSASTVRKMCSISNNTCVSFRVKWGYHGSLHIVVCAFIYVESRTPLKSLSAKSWTTTSESFLRGWRVVGKKIRQHAH